MDKNILLIGFMGTGKTTISHELHHITGMEEIDLDAYIVEKAGMPIKEIFEKQGEEYFRNLETDSLGEVLEKTGMIISCGGGTVIREENVSCMRRRGSVIMLTAEPRTVYERVKDTDDRPVLNGNMNVEYIASLMEKRSNLYLRAADIVVSTDGKSVGDICGEILEKMAQGRTIEKN